MTCDGSRAVTRSKTEWTCPLYFGRRWPAVSISQPRYAHKLSPSVLLLLTLVPPSHERYWLHTPFCCFGFRAAASRFCMPPHGNRVYQSAWRNVREDFCQVTGVAWGVFDTNVSVQYTSFGNFFSNPAAYIHCISVFFFSD